MTDPGDVDDFDDPSHEEVRALLGDARVTDPIPDDVLARLDATLADLTADRARSEGVVVPLVRPRRRTGSRLLVAAAAVLVVGGGGLVVAHVLDDSTDTLASTSAGNAPTPATSLPESAPLATAPAEEDSVNGLTGATKGALDQVPMFTRANFTNEAAGFVDPADASLKDLQQQYALNRGPASAPAPAQPPTANLGTRSTDTGSAAQNSPESCTGPADPSGEAYRIRFDGEPAVLVVRPPVDGAQVVTAWSCDGTQVLLSTTVPAR